MAANIESRQRVLEAYASAREISANVLVEKFNIMPIGTPDEDLKAILG